MSPERFLQETLSFLFPSFFFFVSCPLRHFAIHTLNETLPLMVLGPEFSKTVGSEAWHAINSVGSLGASCSRVTGVVAVWQERRWGQEEAKAEDTRFFTRKEETGCHLAEGTREHLDLIERSSFLCKDGQRTPAHPGPPRSSACEAWRGSSRSLN